MEAKFLASVISFLSIFLAIYADTEFLVPNYDNAEHQLKVYEIRSPLVLSCNITKAGDYVLKWEKNGTDVAKVKELAGRYRIIAAERKFIIDRTDVADDGLYSCVADDQKKDFNVVARVIVRVPSNTGVVEGEKLSIVCTSIGTDPQLSWKIGNLTLSNSTGRYFLKPDDNQVKNAILSIENVSLNDRGEYICIGRNDANEYAGYDKASDMSYVRVKGKLAALWPFLGICAEVLILCAIILIYEKRRNKSELEESDTDPQDHENEVIEETVENTETFEIDDEPVKIIRLHSDSYYKRHRKNVNANTYDTTSNRKQNTGNDGQDNHANDNGNRGSNVTGNQANNSNGNRVSNGNGNRVSNVNGNHVSNDNDNHVSNDNGNRVSNVNGNHGHANDNQARNDVDKNKKMD